MGTWSRDDKMHHWKKVLANSVVNLNAGCGCDKLDFCLLMQLIQAHLFSSLKKISKFYLDKNYFQRRGEHQL